MSTVSIHLKLAVDAVKSGADKATQYIKKIDTAVSKLNLSFNNLISPINQSLGLLGVSGGLLAMSGHALKLAGEFDEMAISLVGVSGGLEMARANMEAIETLSSQTIVPTEELAQASRMMLATGVATNDTLIPALRNLQDIAGGTGTSITSLTSLISYLKQKGEIDGRSLTTMLKAGIPIIDETAKAFKMSREEAEKLIHSGMGFDKVQHVLAKMSDEGGIFHGIAKNISGDTITGQLGTLTAQIQMMFRQTGQEIQKHLNFPKITEKVLRLAVAIKETLLPPFIKLIQIGLVMAPTIIKIVGAMVAFAAAITAIVAGLKAWAIAKAVVLSLSGPTGWATLAAGAAAAGVAIWGINKAFDAVNNSVEKLDISGFTDDQRQLADVLGEVAIEANNVADELEELTSKSERLKESLQTPLEKFATDVSELTHMLEENLITQTQYQTAIDNLWKETDKSRGGMLEYIESLQIQVDTFGQSKEAIELYKRQLAGASDKHLDLAKSMQNQIQWMERQKEMFEEGKRLTEDSMTSKEKFLAQAEKLNQLLDNGAISWDVYSNQIDKSAKSLMDLEKATNFSATVGLEKGSTEARKAIIEQNLNLQNNNQKPKWTEVANATKRTADGTEELVDVLSQFDRASIWRAN